MGTRSDGAAPALATDLTPKNYVDAAMRAAGAVLPTSQRMFYAPGIITQIGAALISGRGTWHPCPVLTGSYDALIINVTTAQSNDGAVTCKVAVYPDDGTGAMPNTSGGPLAVVTAPALTSTAQKVMPLAAPWAATAGLYWMHVLYIATTAPTTTAQLSCIANCSYAIPTAANLFTARIRGWQRTGLTDVPSDATTPTTANVSGSGANDIPVVGLRRT